MLLIKNALVMTPNGAIQHGWLATAERRIHAIGAGAVPDLPDAQQIDAGGRVLLPGFIDVHVHGAMGHEAMDATPTALQTMARFYAQHGVTAFLPTTWTDADAHIQAALENIAACVGAQPDGATILGAHQEGPYLNPKKCGAQSDKYIRRANPDEARRYLDLGVIRLLALAPEYTENQWLIEECVRRGIAVSAAHTDAGYEEMQAAFRLGLRHATHTFNAMEGLHHRRPGAVGAVMTAPHVYAELIADGIHVHPAVMDVLLRTKGAGGLVLVTDAIRGAGMPDGEYQIDERRVTIRASAVLLPDGTLAGSTLTMNAALRNLIAASGKPLNELWQTSSLNAARAINIAHQKGSLEVGKDADLVLVDDDINVFLTVAEGRVVYDATH